MKMFKKLMAIALVGVMALSMLTGCAVTDAIKEKALREGLGSAASTELGNGKKVTFKGDNDLDKVAKKAVEGLTYGSTDLNPVDEKYAVAVTEIKKSTNTADEFKNGYGKKLVKQLTTDGVVLKEGTHKLGVKFFNLEDKANNKTYYYVIVVAEKPVA